jgi:hypothetical protein
MRRRRRRRRRIRRRMRRKVVDGLDKRNGERMNRGLVKRVVRWVKERIKKNQI